MTSVLNLVVGITGDTETMVASPLKSTLSNFLSEQGFEDASITNPKAISEKIDNHQFNKALVEECVGGILVFTEQQQLVYASKTAHQVLRQLNQESSASCLIPDEILHICQSLIQSRHLFPEQNWLIEFDIFTNAATTLHICSRWLTVDVVANPCLLLTIEDRQQAILNLVLEEANRYGLTPREKEVWLLQHNNYTYKQIAAKLGITPNTVKKHTRSIYAKKKAHQEEA